jgi:putative ABC transport system permease protein
VGIGVAVLLTRSVSALLYGVKASDPATFASMSALLIVAAIAGCYVPALRATRVQPIVALKTD